MRPPTFLLTHNEAAQPGAAFVVHTHEPAFVGQIKTFDNNEELQSFVNKNECVVVNEQVIVHIMKYFNSNEFRRIEATKRRLRNWMLKNWIQG
ncbi:hypothetical protein [Runella zeae]|uniref:hypothetical protein n=1 Tax=Runella zeae TaxID=94255 RepID=UPI0023551D6D|nr:hypothetical protein [Runella zeae]